MLGAAKHMKEQATEAASPAMAMSRRGEHIYSPWQKRKRKKG
jgi:hypothetical protein